MPVHRLPISDDFERELKVISTRKNLSIDAVLQSFVDAGLRHEGIGWFGRLAKTIGVAIFIAAAVVAALALLSLPSVFIYTSNITSPDIMSRALHWVRIFIQLMLPWPFTIILLAWIFFSSPSAFRNLLDLFGLFRRFKFLGAEVELNEQTRQKIQMAASDISAAIETYRKRINDEVSRLSSWQQLDRTLANFVNDEIFKRFGRDKTAPNYRCTLYIADPVHEHQLYQVVDYYPKGGGAFRSFSQRYGIIGKVWRSEDGQIVGTLLKDVASGARQEEKISQIMQDWGMNAQEAERALEHPSYICFLLIHEKSKVGLIYMDSTEENAFQTEDESYVTARGNAGEKNTTKTGKEIMEELAETAGGSVAPRIAKILDSLASISLRIEV